MIGSETIFSALVVVTLFLIVLSVPSVFVTLSHSSKQFKKYRRLREMMERGVCHPPADGINEWNAIKTEVGYISVLTEELEKLGALRSALFNSEIAAVLIVILMIIPGFERDVFIIMAGLLALCLLALFYGYRVMKGYSIEYYNTARAMTERTEESTDNMYV